MRVELPVDANLPVEYLPGERLRLEAYRALANATTDEAVDAVAEELVDRFGPLPEPVRTSSPSRGSGCCAARTASPRCRCRATRSGSRR